MRMPPPRSLPGPAVTWGRRLPAAPLRELVERRVVEIAADDPAEYYRTRNSVARELRMSGQSMKLLFERDTVWYGVADRVCCALGLHPAEVFGSDWTADA